ncbi:hypothetical protein AAVH_41620, partial [Aphelenchoides avenae]
DQPGVVDDLLVFPERCQSYHHVTATDVISVIAKHRRSEYEQRATSPEIYENVEFYSSEFHPEITPLGIPLCTIFDPWFRVTADEFVAYVERCWSSMGYFFKGFHNDTFVKALLLSRAIQTSERLHMYGIANAEN